MAAAVRHKDRLASFGGRGGGLAGASHGAVEGGGRARRSAERQQLQPRAQGPMSCDKLRAPVDYGWVRPATHFQFLPHLTHPRAALLSPSPPSRFLPPSLLSTSTLVLFACLLPSSPSLSCSPSPQFPLANPPFPHLRERTTLSLPRPAPRCLSVPRLHTAPAGEP
eukprot:363700-Chlamydomonas_euryale.AAC.1